MKKIILSLAAVFSLTTAQAQDKPITETTVDIFEGSTTVVHHLYNEQGNVLLTLTEGIEQKAYFYNGQGQAERMEYTSFVSPNANRTYIYTYNDLGQKASEEELAGERSLGTTTYLYDDHGNVTTTTNSRSGMPIKTNNSYDNDGNLIKVETIHPMAGVVMSTVEYTYENGLLVKKVSSNSSGVTGIVTYAYDNNATLISSSEEDEVGTELTRTTYAYADPAAYAPQDVTATANPGNIVTLTWQGTANSIVVNGQFIKVSGNSYNTEVLTDGQYIFYVANDGNAVATEPVDVIDDTKVGVSDVQLNGDITYTHTEEQNNDGEMVAVTYYNIPIKWTLPESAQPQSYQIYYNDIYSVTVEDGSLREYVIPARNTTAWSMASGVYTLPFKISVIAIYATGEAEPQNVVTFTLEETEEIIAAGMSAPLADKNSQKEVFTIGGIRMENGSALPKGTYIMRQGGDVRKVQVK